MFFLTCNDADGIRKELPRLAVESQAVGREAAPKTSASPVRGGLCYSQHLLTKCEQFYVARCASVNLRRQQLAPQQAPGRRFQVYDHFALWKPIRVRAPSRFGLSDSYFWELMLHMPALASRPSEDTKVGRLCW